ncbi:curli production assembly protein CsgE [Vibrio galatheae]|uniref:Curli production assembly/transport component CsgE n=1 Tax=Vibrio galatheae TaxID=579748 RepID=A0A0F4NI96_9VIBR|nr:curli production assembly/transport protein CsgE [Vibrio galatheae]KJY82855.1 curli production assembly protein CsgE [Vibrio galatheae]
MVDVNSVKIIVSLLLFFLIFPFFVLAEELGSDNDENNKLAVQEQQFTAEVQGLIVDRTMTRLGDDFYFFFSQYMNDRHGSLEENLVVKERPTALSGSIISVLHRDKVFYRTALSPGRKSAQDKAKEALSAATNYLLRWKAQREYQDTFDLDRDEF